MLLWVFLLATLTILVRVTTSGKWPHGMSRAVIFGTGYKLIFEKGGSPSDVEMLAGFTSLLSYTVSPAKVPGNVACRADGCVGS